jgi:uncharacterized membrane protein YcfT
MALQATGARVDWVDYAKGWCIVLVVMMHSTLGVGDAIGHEGWLHHFVEWARPFRMPDFFLVAGLFLHRTIDRDWRSYGDRKVVHFLYFYTVWLLIQAVLKLWPHDAATVGDALAMFGGRLAWAYVEPFSTLWFIYLLPVFFIVTKLLRRVPALLVLASAAALQMARIHTGYTMVDEFADRYVYFFAGYALSAHFFAFAAWVRARPGIGIAGLLVWAVVNGVVVVSGFSLLPGVSLVLGFAGAMAVIAFAALLARRDLLPPLRYAGANSIVVYLAFFLPMAATRVLLVKTGMVSDVGAVSLIVTAVAVVVPLLMYLAVRNTGLRFLFERPRAFRFERRPARLLPAE